MSFDFNGGERRKEGFNQNTKRSQKKKRRRGKAMGLKPKMKNTRERDGEVDPANGRSCWLMF